MKTATIREAQHHLSKLVDEMLETGTELILTRRGRQVCRISPLQPAALTHVDWKKVHAEMDHKLRDIPAFEYDISARVREDERY
jgi:antitoxin (DNA-binding transcriptional repressor) of toxin-antitoxin stability system